MIRRQNLLKVLDDNSVIYAQNEDHLRVKSIHTNNWYHIYHFQDDLVSIYNGNTGNLMAYVNEMDNVFIKNGVLTFENKKKSHTIGVML